MSVCQSFMGKSLLWSCSTAAIRDRTVNRWVHSSRTDCQGHIPDWSERNHFSSTSQHAPGRRAQGSEGEVQSGVGGWVLPNRKMNKLIQRHILIQTKETEQTENWPGEVVLGDEMWPQSCWGGREALQEIKWFIFNHPKTKHIGNVVGCSLCTC